MNTSCEARMQYNINEDTLVSSKSEMKILEAVTDNSVVETGEAGVPAETGETLATLLATSDLPESSLAIVQHIVDDSLATLRTSLHRPLARVVQTHYDLLVTVAQS